MCRTLAREYLSQIACHRLVSALKLERDRSCFEHGGKVPGNCFPDRSERGSPGDRCARSIDQAQKASVLWVILWLIHQCQVLCGRFGGGGHLAVIWDV